ncbi:MAG: sulfatase-like hydrolase/transferase, partial [Bacteroidales bacterium]
MLFHVGLLIGEDVSIGEIFQIFPHAFMLDLSTICYLLIFPVVVLFISAYFPSSKWKHVFCAYTLIITLLYALIVFSEIGIYGEWRSKLGYKAFLYIKQPMEIFRSISMWHIFIYIVLIALYVGGCAFACTKWVTEDFDRKAKTWWGPLLYILCVPGLLFLGLRGGWNQIPIYQSRSFFSNKQILNDIAVNPAWNLLRSIEVGVGKTERNPYEFYPISEAKIVVESIYQVKKDTTVKILSIDKPNIVFIVLEGWTADVLESLGGKPGITPCLHRLEKKGLLFTNVYASGKRSPQGIASIFAGFPALPDTYVFNFPEKSHKLPSLADKFKKMEYATSFYYGGVLSFDNIRAFLTTGGFDKMVEEKDYSSRLHKCKFGYPDEYVFARQFEEISTTKEPFFSVIYTLSSHTPYDQPFPKVLHWDVPELDYI